MAEEMSGKAPIIIRRKKVEGHGGHHGGAWKVAYADFVTAMMALFIVLWLMNTSEKVQKAISGYFKDPTGAGNQTGSDIAGIGSSLAVGKDDMNGLKDKLEQAVKAMPNFDTIKDHVAITVTGDGLRVELLETEKGMFFESGKAIPSSGGAQLLTMLTQQLRSLPNRLLIEGHTDAKPYSTGRVYTNWELSADRANSARRLMESSGLREGQVAQVRGFADQQLRNVKDPVDAANRRVTVIVQYLNAPPGAKEKAPAPAPQSEKKAPAKH